MTKSEGYICLSRKAGLIQIGEANVKNAAQSGKAVLILITNDVSEPTRERGLFMAERFSVPVCIAPFSKDELADMCGKCGCMAAFTDAGIAAAYAAALSQEDSSYAPVMEKLSEKKASRRVRNKKTV